MFTCIDLLSQPVQLQIRNRTAFKTNCGACATLLMMIISLFAFFGFGRDIIAKEQPKVTFNRIINDKVPVSYLTDDNFMFAIYDQASDTPIPDYNRRFQTSFNFYSRRSNGNNTQISNVPVEPCGPAAIAKWEGYYAAIGKANYLCFPKDQQWEIIGVMLQGDYTSLRLQTSYCVNNTDSTKGPVQTNCIPQADTIKNLTGKNIQMHYIIENTLVNALNFTTPVSKSALTDFTNTNTYSWTRLTITFKTLVTNTDEGFFISTINSLYYPAIDSINSLSIYSPGAVVFSHLIGNSRYKESYTRTYIKVQEVFAMMGGFISAALMILRFYVIYVEGPNLADYFNQLYKFKCVDANNETTALKNSNSILSHLKIRGLNVSNAIQIMDRNIRIGGTVNNYTENMEANYKTHKEKNYLLKMNVFQRNFRLCCQSRIKKEYEIYKELERKMNKTMSVENLAKLTKYMKFLKLLLLDDSQKQIIKICENPKMLKKDSSNDNPVKSLMDAIEEEKNDKIYNPNISQKLLNFLN